MSSALIYVHGKVASVSFNKHQDVTSASNETAFLNITSIVVALVTFHNDKSWLNERAPSNMPSMLVTCDTSHDEMSLLNSTAS